MQYSICTHCIHASDEYVQVVLDYGGRVEDLHLKSRSGEKVWPVLLTENGNASAIIENVWSRGMLLLPWANRIAYVSLARHHAGAVSHVTVTSTSRRSAADPAAIFLRKVIETRCELI